MRLDMCAEKFPAADELAIFLVCLCASSSAQVAQRGRKTRKLRILYGILTPQISAERCVAAPDEPPHLAGCTSLLPHCHLGCQTTLGMEP